MKNKSRGMILAFGIIALFIVSAMTPIIGYEVRTTDDGHVFIKCLLHKLSNYDCNSKSVDLSKKSSKPVLIEKEVSSHTAISDGLMDSAWPMKCHDKRHTSQSLYNTSHISTSEKWRFETEYLIEESVAIDSNGMLYFGSWDRNLYCLYPNGTVYWTYPIGTSFDTCPAIDESGIIYIGTYDDKNLDAIYPNGTRKWRFNAEDFIDSSPVIGEDGTIYFGVMGPEIYSGRFYAIDKNGTEKWHFDVDHYIMSDPAIDDNGIIYFGSIDTYLYALYPNGTLKWKYKTGDWIRGPPSIAVDGTIYIGSLDRYLHAVYPNGTCRWKTSIDWGSDVNPSIANDGTIYVGGEHLYAINPDGTIKWEFNLGEDHYVGWSSPAISAEGIVYIGTVIGGTDGGEIIAVNPDGTERWRKLIASNYVASSPSIGPDGTVYIASCSDKEGYSFAYVHAFGTGGEPNEPPNTPSITGPTEGHIEEWHEYTLVTMDPENQDVRYLIDWGDGYTDAWVGPYNSGEEVIVGHWWFEFLFRTLAEKMNYFSPTY